MKISNHAGETVSNKHPSARVILQKFVTTNSKKYKC